MKSKPLYKVRQLTDLKDMLEQSSKLFGDNNAYLLKNQDGSFSGITYRQFKDDVDALGTAFIELGLKDRFIAVIGENRYEWCVTYLATVNGTGVIVPIDKELPAQEIEYLLARCAASAVVFSGKHQKDMEAIADKIPSLKYLVSMDIESDQGPVLSYRSLVNRGAELIGQGCRSFLDAEIDKGRMCSLLFTSGTTGVSKGVMLSHKNICTVITSVCQTVYIDSADSLLSILPLHHTYECTISFLTLIYAGGTLSFCEGLKHIAKNLKEVKPTLMVAVPLILENAYNKIWEQAGKRRGMKTVLTAALFVSNILYRAFHIDLRKKLFKEVHENLGGRMRLVVSGAAALDPFVCKGFRRFGIPVLQGYGLTECAPLVTGNRDNNWSYASIGLPIPGVEVKIADPDEKGVGELAVRGDNVMLGYYQDEEATRKCIKDGWLYTGDLGKLDKKGFFFITGRSKNVIVTKNGKNIYPEEIESYINKSPFVTESLVWGKQDKNSGETLINVQIFPNLEAIKEKFSEAAISGEQLNNILHEVIKNVNKGIPIYKRIRSFSIRDSEFVKTTTKKIKRFMADVEHSGGNLANDAKL